MPFYRRMGPPEAYGQPPRTNRAWFDVIAAIAAIVISVVSLVVSIRGEKTQHGLLAENAWPFLQLSVDIETGDIRFDVENAGVGPARIYTFEVSYNHQPVASALDLLHRCCLAPGATAHIGFGSVYGNVLRPGEHITALRIADNPETADLYKRFRDARGDMTFQTCYCSILNECWTSDLQSLDQSPVAACKPAAHQFVLNEKKPM